MQTNFEKYKTYIKDNMDKLDEENIQKVINFLWVTYNSNDPIFIIGNGGSAANASHFAQDLAKGTFASKIGLSNIEDVNKTFKAISLTDNISFITAVANDSSYENIFVDQLKSLANKDAVLIAISGSGNSPNIIKAANWANSQKIPVISFTGYDGGKLKKISTFNINVNVNDMMAVETIHSFILHYIVQSLKLMRI